MEHTKIRKSTSSMLCILLIFLAMVLAIAMPTSMVNAKAETVEEGEQVTVETIADSSVFITFTKGESDAKGQYIYACYFVPEEYYDSSLTYGVLAFPRWYAERYGVTGNYVEELPAADKIDNMPSNPFPQEWQWKNPIPPEKNAV